MNIFKALLSRKPSDSGKVPDTVSKTVINVRPLAPIAAPTGKAADIAAVTATPEYSKALSYFTDYPGRSLMSDHSRAILYSLVRMTRPKRVAEIGTLYAGTSEVLARALWENGGGTIHTADPYGGERCPAIIAQWPVDLQTHADYRALSSMDFFARMVLESKTFGLVLIDGNHDYEYALFDLQMAARQIEPGGIVVMDNSEQAGPVKAARSFLHANPAWREIGSAMASYDASKPFDRTRASLRETSFLVLQAPEHLSIGAGPHSWGQAWVDEPRLAGLRFDILWPCAGTLHYQVYLRGFADGNRWVKEERQEGSVRLDVGGAGGQVEHRFDRPMSVSVPAEHGDALFTLELDLSWQADRDSELLSLRALPTPLAH